MKECTTHHHACACREAYFAEIERENEAMLDGIDNADAKLADRDAEIAALKARVAELEAQAGGEGE